MIKQQMEFLGITKETEACVNCKHYITHYIKNAFPPLVYTPILNGHCTYPRLKIRAMGECCIHFERCKAAE